MPCQSKQVCSGHDRVLLHILTRLLNKNYGYNGQNEFRESLVVLPSAERFAPTALRQINAQLGRELLMQLPMLFKHKPGIFHIAPTSKCTPPSNPTSRGPVLLPIAQMRSRG